MKISISQPTLPYEGYFELINYVDKFVFLDSVQFDNQLATTKLASNRKKKN